MLPDGVALWTRLPTTGAFTDLGRDDDGSCRAAGAANLAVQPATWVLQPATKEDRLTSPRFAPPGTTYEPTKQTKQNKTKTNKTKLKTISKQNKNL